MILKLIYKIYRDDNQLGQIYNKLYGILSIFYDTNPNYSLGSVSINISYTKDNKRHYEFLLKSEMCSENDIRGIVNHIEDMCRSRGIELKNIDRLFVRVLLVGS